jgi:arylsulfatase A-like enzyme
MTVITAGSIPRWLGVPLSPGRAIVVGAWVGVVTGLADPILMAVKRWGLGIPVYDSIQTVWMAPLSYAVLFAVLGGVMALAGRVRWLRWLASPRLIVVLTVFAGLYSALHVLRVQLHWIAILLLPAGVAVQLGGAAARRPDGFWRVVRRSAPWLVGLVVVLAGAVNGRVALAERRALAALGPARAGLPNIVVIILDTVRAASMSLYGHERPTTPELERLVRDGAVFDRAVVPSSWSNPSHASMFTGQYAHNVSADWGTDLDDTHPTLAEVLAGYGYVTGGFSANTRYITRQSGIARGFVRFEDHVVSLGAVVGSTWLGARLTQRDLFPGRHLGFREGPQRKHAPDVLMPMLEWIDGVDGRPFYAMANLMDAHEPYVPREPFASRFRVARRSVLDRVWGRIRRLVGAEVAVPPGTPTTWEEHALRSYEATIAYLDHEMGRLIEELDRRGLRENTLVIITSDHGEEFGERHGIRGHGKSLYWPVVHVPLVLRLPGRVPAGVRVSEPVTLRGLPVTIADLAGIDDHPLPGRSFARAWDGSGVVGDTVLIELTSAQDAPRNAPIGRGDMKAVVLDSLQYIRNGDGSEEVYNIVSDPTAQSNLIDQVDPVILSRFRAIIDAIPKQTRSVRQTF